MISHNYSCLATLISVGRTRSLVQPEVVGKMTYASVCKLIFVNVVKSNMIYFMHDHD